MSEARVRQVRFWRVLVSPPVIIGVAALSQLGFLLYGLFGEADTGTLGGLVLGMLIAQPLLWLAVGLLALRFALIFPDARPELRVIAEATVIGIGLNLLLPSRLSEVPRLAYLRHRAGASTSSGAGAIVLEKMSDLSTMLVLVTTLLAVGLMPAGTGANFAAISLILALLVLAGLGLAARRLIVRAVRRLGFARLADFAERLSDGIAASVTRPLFYVGMLIALATFGLVVAGYVVLLAYAIPEAATWKLGALIFVASTIGASLSGLPGGTVGFHGAVMVVLVGAGVSASLAAAAAVAIHLQQYLVLTPLAVWFVRRSGLTLSELIWCGPGEAAGATNPAQVPCQGAAHENDDKQTAKGL